MVSTTTTENLNTYRWMLEKHKGYHWQVCWNGKDSMQLAYGEQLQVPDRIQKQLPNIAFEAFLYCDSVQESMSHESPDYLWNHVQMIVFDSPLKYHQEYEDRLQFLRESIKPLLSPFISPRYRT